MTISTKQRIKILELWAKVCKDRGWKVGDRELRLATIGGFLHRKLASLDDVERLAECTKVLAELQSMLGVSVKAGLETADPGRNRKRNWKWLIGNEVLPCLALYPLDAPMGDVGAHAYLVEVMTDKSRYRKTDRPGSEPTLEDFEERAVRMIYWTLNARLNQKRKEAGHSGHEMCLLAGITCKCGPCLRSVVPAAGPLLPPLASGSVGPADGAKVVEVEGGK